MFESAPRTDEKIQEEEKQWTEKVEAKIHGKNLVDSTSRFHNFKKLLHNMTRN